jgi:hypothetical protein
MADGGQMLPDDHRDQAQTTPPVVIVIMTVGTMISRLPALW